MIIIIVAGGKAFPKNITWLATYLKFGVKKCSLENIQTEAEHRVEAHQPYKLRHPDADVLRLQAGIGAGGRDCPVL